MVTTPIVSGGVAHFAQLVKEVGHLAWDEAIERQPAQKVAQTFLWSFVPCCPSGNGLCKQFGELAKLDDAGVGSSVK